MIMELINKWRLFFLKKGHIKEDETVEGYVPGGTFMVLQSCIYDEEIVLVIEQATFCTTLCRVEYFNDSVGYESYRSLRRPLDDTVLTKPLLNVKL